MTEQIDLDMNLMLRIAETELDILQDIKEELAQIFDFSEEESEQLISAQEEKVAKVKEMIQKND